MLPDAELAEILPRLPRVSLGGPWTRILAYHLLLGPPPGASPDSPPQPLWSGGPVLRGARFSPKGAFGSIYLASDPVTALREVEAIFEAPEAPSFTLRTPPWTVFAVEGVLIDVLDLTDPLVQSQLGTSLAELTGDWRVGQSRYLLGEAPMPPTQRLGQAAYESGAEIVALRFPSARRPDRGINLVAFAERLRPDKVGYLDVFDPNGRIRQRLP